MISNDSRIDTGARGRTVDIVGAIEAGGTKFVCAIATADGELLEQVRFPTTSPGPNYDEAMRFIISAGDRAGELRGVGIGHFGPLDVDPGSHNYGRISKTPKAGWSGANVLDEVARHTDLPVAIDTDVNCAALAEQRWGAGQGVDNLIYITVGTGIGAGIICDGRVLYGKAHPEVGHMMLPKLDEDRDFDGACPYHGARCAEGLAAGPAIEKRWQCPASSLGETHPAWDIEANYLAMLIINLLLVASPQKIILGGGVMGQAQLFPAIRARFVELLNDYADLSVLTDSVDDLIVPTGLGANSGILGASAIAARFCP